MIMSIGSADKTRV